MKILALEEELPGIGRDRFGPMAKAEASRLWELYLEGLVREAFFRADRKSAVLVMEAPTIDEASAALETLPFVREKLIRFRLIPLAPYAGFGRLFAPPEPLPRGD